VAKSWQVVKGFVGATRGYGGSFQQGFGGSPWVRPQRHDLCTAERALSLDISKRGVAGVAGTKNGFNHG